MIHHWDITYKDRGITCGSSVRGNNLLTEDQAVDEFFKQGRFFGGVPKRKGLKVRRGGSTSETFEELKTWMTLNGVTPEQAQGAIHCMVINSRPENQRPHICEKCKTDMNKTGFDHVGNAYSCSKCGNVFQVG